MHEILITVLYVTNDHVITARTNLAITFEHAREALSKAMSFLAADDPLLEADGTLEAALAFLDNYSGVREEEDGLGCLGLTSEGSCGSPPSGTPSVSPCSLSTDSTQGAEDGGARSARRSSLGESTQGKTKRSNAPAAMRLRRKRKAERLLLREQVEQLEALLRRLRQARGSSRTHPRLAASRRTGAASAVETVDEGGFVRWADVATQIQRERQQAEVENVQLREILGKQVKLARSLEGLLQKRGVFQVRGAVLSLWMRMPVALTLL